MFDNTNFLTNVFVFNYPGVYLSEQVALRQVNKSEEANYSKCLLILKTNCRITHTCGTEEPESKS